MNFSPELYTPLTCVFVLMFPYFIPGWLSYIISTVCICYVAHSFIPKPRAKKRRMSFVSEAMCKPYDQSVLPDMPHPIINAAIYFEELPSLLDMRAAFKGSLFKFVRFNSIPVAGKNGLWEWVDRGCEVDDHIHCSAVASDATLEKKINDVMDAPLKLGMSAPCWEIHYIKNSAGPSMILFRVHHAVGDGISLMKAFLSLITMEDGSPYPIPSNFNRKRVEKSFITRARDALTSIKSVLMLPIGPYDSDLKFNEANKPTLKYTGNRKVVFMPDVQLDWIKRMKNQAHVTVNDVMVCATAGTIRRYCEYRGDGNVNKSDVLCRALLPIAFPRPNLTPEMELYKGLRNRWCFVSMEMLVGEKDPVRRLSKTSVLGNTLKTTPVAPIQMGLQDVVLPLLPVKLAHKTFHDLCSRHSLVFSNVPGPDKPVCIGGKTISALQMIYPNLITQVGVLSYNGKIQMNFVVDEKLIPESEKLAEFYIAELKAMGDALCCPR